ncbi:acyl-CoA dehydrogenase family protein, partial [Kitasatospora sp. NPDC001539]|uniref:acyl-CoA dehydrogenase family protein n=1 Tax=Kitasatospora sp. NPDC001539 TaxID=3154384 RepID=UPI003318D3FF
MTTPATTDRPSNDRSPIEGSDSGHSASGRAATGDAASGRSKSGHSASTSGQSAPGQSAPGRLDSGRPDRGRRAPGRPSSGHPDPGRTNAPEPDRSAIEAALAGLPRVVDLLAARAEEHDRDATFPYQGIEAVHEAGLLTLTVSPRYGGPGGTLADTVRVLAQLGRGDASVAVVTAFTLLRHAEQARSAGWPTAGYRRLLSESRRGPALVTTLRAEPGGGAAGAAGSAGADGLPATVARRDGDGWLLTGRKTYCTGAEALAWMAVTARTDEPEPRVGTFLVRGESEGLEIDPTWDQLGLRASASHDVVLDGVRVPAELALGLGAPGSQDHAEAELARAWQDLALAAVAIGVARAAESWLVRFLSQRTPANLTEPLGTLPRYRCALGEIEAQLIGAEELVEGLAPRVDRGEPDAVARTGPAQVLATRAATAAVQQAVALTGNPGLSQFGIRHQDAKQQTEYDSELYLEWIFYWYVAT